jgi:hypothetical protein
MHKNEYIFGCTISGDTGTSLYAFMERRVCVYVSLSVLLEIDASHVSFSKGTTRHLIYRKPRTQYPWRIVHSNKVSVYMADLHARTKGDCPSVIQLYLMKNRLP